MNAFELRRLIRQNKAKARGELKVFTKILDAVGVQRFFEDGFRQVYGKEPNLKYKKGWFYLQGKRVSQDDLLQRGKVLWSKLHEKELNNEEST